MHSCNAKLLQKIQKVQRKKKEKQGQKAAADEAKAK